MFTESPCVPLYSCCERWMRAFDYKVLPTTYEIIIPSTEEASHIMTKISNLLSHPTSMLFIYSYSHDRVLRTPTHEPPVAIS